MNTIINIVNQSKHPIDSDEYIQYCNDEIKKNSILILNDFLTNDCLSELITEAHGLQDQAFYCSQNHTILLNKQDKLGDLNDPLNREVVSDKGCVPHDLLNEESKLNILYNSNIFKKFIYIYSIWFGIFKIVIRNYLVFFIVKLILKILVIKN